MEVPTDAGVVGIVDYWSTIDAGAGRVPQPGEGPAR
jgi:hypothetical protein